MHTCIYYTSVIDRISEYWIFELLDILIQSNSSMPGIFYLYCRMEVQEGSRSDIGMLCYKTKMRDSV